MPITKEMWTQRITLAAAMALPAAIAMAEPLVFEAPSTDLTVLPSATSSAPAPQNPLLALPPAVGEDRILFVPFQASNPNDINPWLGRSIEKSLAADLLASTPGRVIVVDHPVVDNEAALALARQNGARYVVVGDFTTSTRDVRITGQVLDANTGQTMAGLKVTGDTGQLFRMEDGLAIQLKTALGMPSGPAPMANPSAPMTLNGSPAVPADPAMTNVPTAQGIYANPYYSSYAAPPDPTVYGANPAPSVYYPTYPDYDYGNYDYGYPYFGGSYGIGLCFPFGWGWGLGSYGGYGRSYYHNHYGYNHGGFRASIYNTNGHSGIYPSATGLRANIGGSLYAARSHLLSPAYRSSSYAPYRSSAFYSRGVTGSRSSGFTFHASPSYHSFGGAGGGHGGGGHAGGRR